MCCKSKSFSYMKLITLSLLTIFLASSCCTKKKCVETKFPGINLYGYSEAEVDTIYIINGTEDTILTMGTVYGDGYSVYSENLGEASLMYIPATGQSHYFNDFTYREAECNECMPPFKDIYMAYEGCNVDGQYVRGNPIKLYK